MGCGFGLLRRSGRALQSSRACAWLVGVALLRASHGVWRLCRCTTAPPQMARDAERRLKMSKRKDYYKILVSWMRGHGRGGVRECLTCVRGADGCRVMVAW